MFAVCHVYKAEREDGYSACCSCGWEGLERRFRYFAKQDAREHAKAVDHQLGDPLVIVSKPLW
jgi:hypothetical protein